MRLKVNKQIVVAIAAITVAIASLRPASAQVGETYTFWNGVSAMLLGDVETAAKDFKKVLSVNPIHAPSFFYLGRIALAVNEYDSAHDLVERAIKIDSSNLTYLTTFAQILIARSEYVEAETLIARLRETDPTNPQYYQIGAALLLQTDRPSEAIALCLQYEKLFGLDERMIDIQRSAYIQTEDFLAAEEYMRRVVAAFPTAADQILALADLNAALRYDSTALSYYERAIAIDTTEITPYLAKANFFEIHGRQTEYIAALLPVFKSDQMSAEKKIEIFEKTFFTVEPYRENFALVARLISTLLFSAPENTAVQMLYGRYLTYSGQLDAAANHYRTLIDQEVSHPELVERLLQIYFYKKQYPAALELSTATYNARPSAIMMEYRAISAWLSKDSKLALSLVGEGLKKFRVDTVRSGFYALQGDIYEQIGQRKKSYASYQRSLRLNDSNVGVLNNYAYHLAVEGRMLDRALEMAEKANKLSPDNATYIDTEAWVLFKLGRYIDAQVLMRRVMLLDPKPSSEVLLHYGDILYELGDDFLARSYWKKAAEAGASAPDIESRVMREKAKRPTNQ